MLTHDSCVQVEEVRRDPGDRAVENDVLSHLHLDELGTRDRMGPHFDWFLRISDGKAVCDLQLQTPDEGPGGHFDMDLIGGRALGMDQVVDQ